MRPRNDRFLLHHREFLSAEQSARLVDAACARGFEPAAPCYPPSYRNNERQIVDDAGLAATLFEAVEAELPAVIEHDGGEWELDKLNSRFRFCRYLPGQQFTRHRDGAHHEGPNRRSFFTVMIYLNDASEFSGGSTRFYPGPERAAPVTESVVPTRGAALIFSHDAWHDGAPVTRGRKFIMRTDVMYRRRHPVTTDGHTGYVWSVTSLAGGRYASGGRDKTVRLWRDGRCESVVGRHSLSVLCVGGNGRDRLWSGSRDGLLRVWRDGGERWQQVREIPAHSGAIIATTDAHRGRFASGGADGVVAVWDLDGALICRRSSHAAWAWALAWTDDGELISGAEDGTLAVADRLAGTGAPVRAATSAGNWIATGDDRGKVALWDRGLVAQREFQAHEAAITALVPLPGDRLATASEDGRVRIWSLSTGAREHERSFEDYVRDLSVHAGGDALLCAGYDGAVRVLSVSDGVFLETEELAS